MKAPSGIRSNSYRFDVELLEEPYREFSWLFAWLVGQDTTAYFSMYVLFVLHLTFRMGVDFNWGQVIWNEISH